MVYNSFNTCFGVVRPGFKYVTLNKNSPILILSFHLCEGGWVR